MGRVDSSDQKGHELQPAEESVGTDLGLKGGLGSGNALVADQQGRAEIDEVLDGEGHETGEKEMD